MKAATQFAIALLGFAMPSIALAGANKTWVSGTGTDSGTCAITAPCKSFQYAHDQTAAGGEIDVKDAGGYGTVIITKAITIAAEGVLASISVPAGGIGVTVKAGANDKVALRGLTIDGHNVANDGIDFKTGNGLSIDNCDIRNIRYIGINLQPDGAKYFLVSNSKVENAQFIGVFLQPFTTEPLGSFINLSLYNNKTGIEIGYNTTILSNSNIISNEIGLSTEAGANVLLTQTKISANTSLGIDAEGGTISSYGDNYINGNATDISGSFGSIARR